MIPTNASRGFVTRRCLRAPKVSLGGQRQPDMLLDGFDARRVVVNY